MKADDFRSQSIDELNHRVREMKKELFNLRMQLHSNQLSDCNKLRGMRRDIARALTVLQEKSTEVTS